MAFRENSNQQLSFNDTLWGLTEREKKALEKSWARTFAEEILMKRASPCYTAIKLQGPTLR